MIKPQTTPREKSVIKLTEQLLSRAAEIDPPAWATPLPQRTQWRRDRSYQQAIKEWKTNGLR